MGRSLAKERACPLCRYYLSAAFFRPGWDFAFLFPPFPALKRWAISRSAPSLGISPALQRWECCDHRPTSRVPLGTKERSHVVAPDKKPGALFFESAGKRLLLHQRIRFLHAEVRENSMLSHDFESSLEAADRLTFAIGRICRDGQPQVPSLPPWQILLSALLLPLVPAISKPS